MSSAKKIPVVSKELLVPFIAATSIFALWGFANDLTNPMVAAFKKVMVLSNKEAYNVQFAFYFGYGVMAIPAALFIRKFNYKSGLLIGLALYAIGAILFYPAAENGSYTYFLISLFVITCGLGFLETTSNPLILSMGDPKTATRRLNLAQSFNPIGSLTGMLVAKFVVLDRLFSTDYENSEVLLALGAEKATEIKNHDLDVISLPYIAVGLFVAFIFLIILKTKIPSKDMGAPLSISESVQKIFKSKTYLFGVIAQTFYVGAQIMCWTAIFQLVEYLNTSSNLGIEATWWNIAAMISFVTTRFIGTALMKNVNPAKMLALFGTMGALMCLGVMLSSGLSSVIFLVMISVFMSIMFPTIYGLALKDMGEEAKLASSGLIMAIVGGAFLPKLQAWIMDFGDTVNGQEVFGDVVALGISEIHFSFILPFLCLIVVAVYGLYASRVKV
ncbi:L-fucose:H+ symporter permease [Flagellimonas sp. HMM57]|uniref:L-fucose:H+ symporter permease n=1 Tax=unclassified Flagellimonas TaxID=2644544 RepID=UPI0013D6372E|nr:MULTISPECIES: L-fucose:H+ symporter permease [unclassified Flagellimonas]UII75369.1 L-fucose:H+ symporter permease [Flagellimonas sp. HMM57]